MNKKSVILIGIVVLIVIISLIIGLLFGIKNNFGENIVWDDNYIVDPNDVKIDQNDRTIKISDRYIGEDGFEPDVNSNINVRGEISFDLTTGNNTEINFILGGGKNGNGHELNNKKIDKKAPEYRDHVSSSENKYNLLGVGNFKDKLTAILIFLITKKNHNGNNDVFKNLKLRHIWIELGFYHPKFNNKPALSIHDFTLAVNSFITDFPNNIPRYTWLLNKNAVILSAPYNIKYQKLTYTFLINTQLVHGRKSYVIVKTNNYHNVWRLKEKLVNNFMSVHLTQKWG